MRRASCKKRDTHQPKCVGAENVLGGGLGGGVEQRWRILDSPASGTQGTVLHGRESVKLGLDPRSASHK